MISVTPAGHPGNNHSGGAYISQNGKFLVFLSSATDLVPFDTNGKKDVFLADLEAGQVSRISLSSSGAESNGDCDDPRVSANGRFIAFCSVASNLVPNDTNGQQDVFLRDMWQGTLSRISVSSSGDQLPVMSGLPSMSANGSKVSFYSYSSVIPADTNGLADIYVRDFSSGTVVRASVSTNGGQSDGTTLVSWVSQDGRFVSFQSQATNLIQGSFSAQGLGYRHQLSAASTGYLTGVTRLSDYVAQTMGKTITVKVIDHLSQAVLLPETPLSLFADGNYALTTALNTSSPCDVVFDCDGFLRKTVPSVPFYCGLAFPDVTLTNGDADESGEVDAVDIDQVISDFGDTWPGGTGNRNSDVDGSGEVDATDIDIVIANFGAVDD